MEDQPERSGCLSALIYFAIYFFGWCILDCVIFRDAHNMSSPDYSWESSRAAGRVQETYLWAVPIALYLWHHFTATPTRSNSTQGNRGTDSTQTLYNLYRQEDELMRSCFNQHSCEFDWKRYFDNRDIIIYCGRPEIIDQMRRDMIHYGELQVTQIVTVLSQHRHEPQRLIQALRRMEPNVILNLAVMAGGGDAKSCPADINTFRTRLYDLIYGRTPYSIESIENLIDLGVRCY